MSDWEELFEGIPWHQRWEIAPGIFTPGGNPVDILLDQAAFPKDLSGKRVLDIGAWNGCFSFECERRNAAEVRAIGPESGQNTGFEKLKRHLGSKVVYERGTIYDLDPTKMGYFDIIICFGVLYHLRHPLLALDMVRRVCAGQLYLETAGIDDNLVLAYGGDPTDSLSRLLNHSTMESRTFEHVRLDDVDPRLSRLSILQFYRLEELNRDSTNWFAMNQRCCLDLLLSSGFKPTSLNRFGHRIAVAADIMPGNPEWMGNSGEGIYYDVISTPIFGPRTAYK